MSILPPNIKNFTTVWISTSKDEQTLDNLITQLYLEENKIGVKSRNEDMVVLKSVESKKNFCKKEK